MGMWKQYMVNMSDLPDESTQKLEQQKILVLHGKQAHHHHLIDILQPHAQIITVNDIDEALEKLKQNDFSAVISETSDFLPLERAAVAGGFRVEVLR